MRIKIIKYIALINLILLFQASFCQNNPGFLGKKIAIGYDFQYYPLGHLLSPETAPVINAVSNHNLSIEIANRKYSSFGFNLGYQKIPIGSGAIGTVYQNYTINGSKRDIKLNAVDGYSDFLSINLGAKFMFYLIPKTVSAPIGRNFYLKFDLYINQALNNNYKFEYAYEDNLEDYSINYVNSHINKTYDNYVKLNYSFGFGFESKRALTRSMYLKSKTEINISPSFINNLGPSNYSIEPVKMSEAIDNASTNANEFRNIFVFGLGVGFLL